MSDSKWAKDVERSLEGLFFEKSRFGQYRWPLFWVEVDHVVNCLEKLKAGFDPKDTSFDEEGELPIRFDRLESIDAMELDEGMVLSYVLGGYAHAHYIVIRISLALFSESTKPKVPSISKQFFQAKDFEREVGRFFGIDFTGGARGNSKRRISPEILTKNFKGFPFRKSFSSAESNKPKSKSRTASLEEGGSLES